MGQTDNSSLALNFQMFSQIFCLRGSIFSVFALEQFIFVLHYVFSDTSSTQLEQDTQGKITKYTLGVLFTSCESCFEDSSTIFTFPCVTVVTPHLLSTIWPFRPHKPYIFWKLMAHSTVSPFYHVLDNMNHIFSESLWHPLSTGPQSLDPPKNSGLRCWPPWLWPSRWILKSQTEMA